MSITEIQAAAPARSPTPASVRGSQPVDASKPEATRLEPAVLIDIRSADRPSSAVEEIKPVEVQSVDQIERRVTVDTDTKSLVYQVVDTSSGEVVVQLPDPVILKARAYAEAAEAKAQATERPVDRIA